MLSSCWARAEVVTAESEGIRATLYAPDWVWKGQNLNFLVVIENRTGQSISPAADLSALNAEIDEFKPVDFAQHVTVEPGSIARSAFANVSTDSAVVGRSYDFRIVIADKSVRIELPATVKIIRGAVIAEGIWAAILPAAVAAAWCVVLAMYFRRHAAPGAWKTPSAPVWDARSHG